MQIINPLLLLLLSLTALAASFRLRQEDEAELMDLAKSTSTDLTEEGVEEEEEVLAPARIPVKPIVRGAWELAKRHGPRLVNGAKRAIGAGVRKARQVGGKIVRENKQQFPQAAVTTDFYLFFLSFFLGHSNGMLTWRHTALPALLAPAQTFLATRPTARAPALMARPAKRPSGLSEIRAGARTSSPCNCGSSSSSSAVAVLTSSTSWSSLTALAASIRLRQEDEAQLMDLAKSALTDLTEEGVEEEEEVLAPARIPVKPIVRGAWQLAKRHGPRLVNGAKRAIGAGVRKARQVGGKIVRGAKRAGKAVWERLSVPIEWPFDDDDD
ncbi:hypothetical protein SprV_0802471500 [Sparganum proliferum]